MDQKTKKDVMCHLTKKSPLTVIEEPWETAARKGTVGGEGKIMTL